MAKSGRMPLIRLSALSSAAAPSRGWRTCVKISAVFFFSTKNIAPRGQYCFLSAPCKGACFSELSLSCESACCAQEGAVFVKMLLSCQMALGVISRRYLRGGTRRNVQRRMCFGGLSANQRRLIKILPSCALAKSPSYFRLSISAISRHPSLFKTEVLSHLGATRFCRGWF